MSRLNSWLLKSTRSTGRITKLLRTRLLVQPLEARDVPATFTVTSLADTLTAGTLRQAVADANNNGTGLDTINFNIPASGTITLGSELGITGSVFIDGPTAFNITVSGNNAKRLFKVDNGSAVIDVTFDQLTLTKGSAADGGAIFSGDENIVVQNCQVTANNATAGDGGAIYISTGGTLAVSNSNISGNTASGNGGGVYFFSGGSVNFTNSAFNSNKSGGTGGGLYFFGSVSAGGFNLTNVTISGNTSTSHGGGIYLNNIVGTLSISSSTVSNNSSSKDGGGLWADSGSFNISASTISGNKGANSAGLYFTGNLGTSNIRNSTIANNTASNNGGGIGFTNVTGTVNLTNSTISGNVANGANSGGFSMYKGSPTVNLESCIVAGNAATDAADFLAFTGTLNVATSAYQTTLGVFNNQGGNIVGPFANLKLGTLASNGGPTQTMRPANDSPLLNAGTNPASLTTDARGVARVWGTAADIGAVEVPTTFTVTNANDAGAGSLRQAILDANLDVNSPSTISFDPTFFATAKTITLTTGEMAISDALTINGPGFDKLKLDGNNASRIFNTETAANGTSITFDGMTMTKGKSTGDGGAIFVGEEVVAVNNCVIVGNTANDGGAINVESQGSGTLARLVIDGSTISGNTALSDGGGVYIFDFGSFLIRNSTMLYNKASGAGGGLYFFGAATAGGIILSQVTISGNSAGNTGGAVVLRGGSGAGTLLVHSSTIVNNTASSGGGISRDAGAFAIDVQSSIISGNTGTNPDITSGGTVTAKFSAIGSNTGFTLTDQGNNLPFQPHANLLLGPAITTGTASGFFHAPGILSPLVDAGSNPGGLSNDQRGDFRTIGIQPDIGTVEVRNFTVLSTADAGPGSLRQTIQHANSLSGADTVTFDPTFFATAKTITLTSGELAISDAITINGTGFDKLTIDGNNASRIFNTETAANGTSITFNGMTMTKGKSTNDGGAINIGQEVVTIRDCVVSNSSASADGGGITIETIGSPTLARLVLDSSTVSGNTASGSGGGIYVRHAGSFLVRNSSIVNNKAGGDGGGLYFYGPAQAGGIVLSQATISGNSAGSAGGGVVLHGSNGAGTLLVHNSTIVSNTASFTGGGIARRDGAFVIDVQSSIISGNTGTDPDISSTGTVTAKFSAIGSNTGFTLTDQGNNLPFQAFANLKLGPLTQGFTAGHLTHSPGPDSPLIDAGSNPNGLGDDQRNSFRTIGVQTDIGTVEVINTIVLNTNDAGPGSLRQTIQHANSLSGTDTVTFDPTVFATAKSINMGGTEMAITESVTIAGPGAALATVNGKNLSRIFNINGPGNLTVNLSGLTLTGANTGGPIEGGAIEVADEFLTLTDCVLTGNTAGEGGAVDSTGYNGKLTLIRCVISNNLATSGEGGGLNLDNGGWTVSIVDSTISGNSATGSGAGFYLGAGSLTMTGSTVSGNTAGIRGGGIYLIAAIGVGGATIRNSTISNNVAPLGGGIHLQSVTGILTIHNSTVTQNKATAGNGGGIGRNGGTAIITAVSTILSGNTATGSGSEVFTTGTANLTDCLLGNASGITTPNFSGSTGALLGKAANLGLLASNGGLTQTHALLGGSPALNAGSNPAALTTDQRGAGFNRSIGQTDIGAFELQSGSAPAKVQSISINGGAAQRSLVTTLAITFDRNVGTPTATAFQLKNQTTSLTPTLAAAVNNTGPGTVVTLTFSGSSTAFGSLSDGRYTLTILAGSIDGGNFDGNGDGTAGDNFQLVGNTATAPKLFRFFGDADGDGDVDNTDFVAFRLAFGNGPSIFDSDGDGDTDNADFVAFRSRFGTSVP